MPTPINSDDGLFIRPELVKCPACKGKAYVPHVHTNGCERDGDTIICRMEVSPCEKCKGRGTVLR